MKKLMLLIIVAVFCTTSTVFAQLDQYVDEVRGDTLVINSYQDMGSEPNALLNAVDEDTDAPDGRVYELKRDSWYPVLETLSSPEDRPLIIAGQATAPVVQGVDDGEPALISGIDLGEDNLNGNMISVQNDVTLKNLSMVTADNSGNVGFQWFNTQSPNRTITLDNVIGEHTSWVFIDSNDATETNVRISDSYFVNMTGETCRRNGGVYDNVNNNTNSIVVENTTHVMGAGVQYKMRGFPIYEVYFNHNTFVNISGQVLGSFGYQSNYIVANNLFVNANVQAYIPGLDVDEFDQDYLPHGLINIDSLRYVNEEGEERFGPGDSTWVTDNYDIPVEEFGPDDRKVLVTNNGIYWDERMYDIPQILNDNDVPCPVTEEGESEENSDCQDPDDEWVTQAITMNSRTQAMFDDDETYPYLQEQDWIEGGDPQFTDAAGLLSDEVIQDLIDWSVDAASIEPGMILPHWRERTLEETFVFPDYPVRADLSYENSEYLNGGLNGMPLGDLNWFPEDKEAWLEIDERAELENMLDTPTSNEEYVNRPVEIQLDQNYPNPFNPTTEISFNLPSSQELTLKVFDMLGREVATIANNELFSAGQNNITFDAGNLASGVYIYRLTSNDVTLSKKMTLIK